MNIVDQERNFRQQCDRYQVLRYDRSLASGGLRCHFKGGCWAELCDSGRVAYHTPDFRSSITDTLEKAIEWGNLPAPPLVVRPIQLAA